MEEWFGALEESGKETGKSTSEDTHEDCGDNSEKLISLLDSDTSSKIVLWVPVGVVVLIVRSRGIIGSGHGGREDGDVGPDMPIGSNGPNG